MLDGNYFKNDHFSLGALTSLKKLSLIDCGLNESTFQIQGKFFKYISASDKYHIVNFWKIHTFVTSNPSS